MSRAAYIVHGARTPFIKAGRTSRPFPAADLGRAAAVEAMARSHVEPAEIDQTIFGNIATPPDAANIGRGSSRCARGSRRRGPPTRSSRNCASGIESIVQAARLIQTGEADVVLAGGAESMSLIPFLYPEKVKAVLTAAGMARSMTDRLLAFTKMPWPELLNPVIGLKEGLTDPVCNLNMGETAEILARKERSRGRRRTSSRSARTCEPWRRAPGSRRRSSPSPCRPRSTGWSGRTTAFARDRRSRRSRS